MNMIVNPFKNLFEDFYDKIKGTKHGLQTIIELELNEKTTTEQIEFAIRKLDHRMVLKFYDAYFGLRPEQKPVTRGDSGAFTTIRKDNDGLKARLGNHGDFKLNGEWIKLTEKEIVERIFKSRNFNAGNMTIESRLIRYRLSRINGRKTVYPIYHDISGKNN